MGIRYLTDDGEVFDDEIKASDHQASIGLVRALKAQVDKYCSMLDYANDRARARASTQIMGWIAYDMKQRPERYHEPADVKVVKPTYDDAFDAAGQA